jgi:hypothetical protein
VLPGELPRQRVELAETLHADEKGLVVVESGLSKIGNLAAKMIFELVQVSRVDGLPAADVGALAIKSLGAGGGTTRTVSRGASRSRRATVAAGSPALRSPCR